MPNPNPNKYGNGCTSFNHQRSNWRHCAGKINFHHPIVAIVIVNGSENGKLLLLVLYDMRNFNYVFDWCYTAGCSWISTIVISVKWKTVYCRCSLYGNGNTIVKMNDACLMTEKRIHSWILFRIHLMLESTFG